MKKIKTTLKFIIETQDDKKIRQEEFWNYHIALFYFANEEISSRKIQNDIYHVEFTYTGFPCWKVKIVGISKNIFLPNFYTLTLLLG